DQKKNNQGQSAGTPAASGANGKSGQDSQSGNGSGGPVLAVQNEQRKKSGEERIAELDQSVREQPAKHLIWNMLHHGGTALAVQGYRELLGTTWRAVFNTRPPASAKPPKKKGIKG
ncbi:MAG TPA: hypothetical protein VHL09_10390, partial [Dehalococcoidia bacterium]|nr:hypothetical protein [Dehalococcoidia bacterium]